MTTTHASEHTTDLPHQERLLTRRMLRRMVPVSDMSIWRWERDGRFPRHITVHGRNYWLFSHTSLRRLANIEQCNATAFPRSRGVNQDRQSSVEAQACRFLAVNRPPHFTGSSWERGARKKRIRFRQRALRPPMS
jgi:predicted DNA-binding transcriptional regulator AlpA